MSQLKVNDLKDDIARYVKTSHLEVILNTLVAEILRKQPTADGVVSYLIQYTYRRYPEEAKTAVLNINHAGFPSKDPKAQEAPQLGKQSSKGGANNQGEELKGQAAVDHYLATNSIPDLFNNIVEAILFSKPANICSFIVDHLCRSYPKAGKEAIRRINKKLSVEASSGEETARRDDDGDGGGSDNDDGDADNDSSSDDEDDYMPEDLPEINKPESKKAALGRRVSVSAESMDPAKLKDQISQVHYVAKSTEVAQSLVKVINKSAMLKRMCEPEQRKLLVKAFSGPLLKGVGEDVIKQGDEGDAFYLLEAGKIDVFVTKNGVTSKVHEYKAGDAFGQLALMYNAPRAATCTVAEDAKLWALDRVSFKVIVVAAAMQKREMYQNFLSQVPILESLTEMEIMTLADSLAEEVYQDGEVVCSQGDEGNDFYIIKEGEAECFKKENNEADVEGDGDLVASLQAGHYFGEIALLTPKPRQATVKAKGKLKVLAIDRAAFTRVFGSLDNILQRNMDQYEKYSIR